MFLGIDGGGTKTAFTLLDKNANIVATYLGSSSYHAEIGLDHLRSLIGSGINAIAETACISPRGIEFSFIGIPGFGENSKLVPELEAIPKVFLPAGKFACANDVVCGWTAGNGGSPGIHIVAGTGSMAYGESETRSGRCGGWSEIFGDEGSAYWIAREGLAAFSRMADGRAPTSILYHLLRDHLAITNDLDVCAIVQNSWNGSRSKIASLAVVVSQAANQGDPFAQQIFNNAASELVDLVKALSSKLAFKSSQYTVTYSGGVFKAGQEILDPLKEKLAHSCPDAILTPSLYTPDIGTALYAAKLSGHKFAESQLALLRKIT